MASFEKGPTQRVSIKVKRERRERPEMEGREGSKRAKRMLSFFAVK